MKTFRITLSHGDEHITFDGAGARSGSMFRVRRDAIEGLWSSPASKVSLTERETANGASPISDGETLYAARTVTIPFAIQSNYNHTDLIRARILLGRLIGWHDVRMDINDDGDETVLFGYIEAKYSDIPYDHADTGTITMVCPDPRKVSKHASTVTMNTSSSSLGGLSFGVHDYVKSWTGTPNASTSTLSQDGKVVATNLVKNPAPDINEEFALSTSSQVSLVDGVVRLSPKVSGTKANVGCEVFNVDVPLGHYYFKAHLRYSGSLWYDFAIWGSDWFTSKTAAQLGSSNELDVLIGFDKVHQENLHIELKAPYDGWAEWSDIGLFTESDYQAMQALGVDWFDGDSQSPQPNPGLAFPLNFGQTGNTGNTGMIVNNGSYTAMPVITAHGNLDSGLTLHWNTSDGHEGDLSFNGNVGNVPVTINTDTHSAIMGGLDVSYLLGSRNWPRIPAGGSCSFALLASGSGWVTVQSHDTYM